MSWIDVLLDTPPRKIYESIFNSLFSSNNSLTEFTDEHPCIFVLSTGRVGSMTLAAMLNYADNLISVHEPRPILYSASKTAYQSLADIESVGWSEICLILRREQFDYSLKLGKGYVETSPQATFLAPILAMAVPNIKFIHLIRHPEDVVKSGMRREWYAGHSADESRITPRVGSFFYEQWEDMTPHQKNIWLWAETNRWIMEFMESVPSKRKFTLHSEDLYAGKDASLSALFKFCGSTLPSSKRINKILSLKMNNQKTGEYEMPRDGLTTGNRQLKTFAKGVAVKAGFYLK